MTGAALRPCLPPARLLLARAALAMTGSTASLALLACAYTAKRRLGIDVVPGVDMLPDPPIEAAIRAVAGVLGL